MKIYFLTREPDVCQLLADKFQETQAEITIFPIATKLLKNIFEQGEQPDILFLDFLYYQAEFFNFYALLNSRKKMFPVVFYNHPFPIPEKRKQFWLYNLKKTGYFSDLSPVEPLLEILQNALNDPNIFPYVSAIQNPKPYRSSNLRYIEPLDPCEKEYYAEHFSTVVSDFILKENAGQHEKSGSTALPEKESGDEFIIHFRARNRLPQKIYTLFSYLYKNRNTHIPVSELCKVLSSHSDEAHPVTPNSLRLTVHRLRNIIQNDTFSKLELISFDHGYMLLDEMHATI